jgi:hypothetical protein
MREMHLTQFQPVLSTGFGRLFEAPQYSTETQEISRDTGIPGHVRYFQIIFLNCTHVGKK